MNNKEDIWNSFQKFQFCSEVFDTQTKHFHTNHFRSRRSEDKGGQHKVLRTSLNSSERPRSAMSYDRTGLPSEKNLRNCLRSQHCMTQTKIQRYWPSATCLGLRRVKPLHPVGFRNICRMNGPDPELSKIKLKQRIGDHGEYDNGRLN